MAVQTIDSALLAKMFLAGALTLENNKEKINELNVFPVPDGDTGTNMTMTVMSAAKEVAALGDTPDMTVLCKAISSGSLRGARGNSGVILSQLLRGFTKIVKTEQEITLDVLVTSFQKAVETAYKAVMKPTEGTILTVARGVSEKATELHESGVTDLEQFLVAVVEHGKHVLDQTPEMLPVLKQAGVVDSGGAGLLEILNGALAYYQGKEMDLTISDEPIATADEEREARKEAQKKSGYRVKYEIALKAPFHTKNEMDVRSYLESVGDAVEVLTEGETVHIHVRTEDPGLALQRGVKYGILKNISIEYLGKAESKSSAKEEKEAAPKGPAKPVGFIAVSAGKGLSEIFRSLGVDYVIEGGQTMNPSTADILNAVEQVNAETVFVLPNNKNIIMAANQASELSTDKQVLVIPTKTIPQGINAIINFIPDLSVEENEQTMLEEIRKIKSGEITYAVRDTEIDDKKISKDDYMGIGDKGILAVGKDRLTVILEMIEAMVDDASELISVYYGSDVTKEDAEEVTAAISEKFSNCDVELQDGGQPIYYFIVSVE